MGADNYTFGGLDLRDGIIRLTKITPYEGLPPLRGKDIPIPSAPGQLATVHQADSRRMALELIVAQPDDSSQYVVHSKLRQLVQAFARPFLQPLVHYHPEGTTRTAQARAVDWQPADISQVGVVYQGLVDFELPDPYFYGAPVVVTQAIAVSPTTFTLTNPGDARGHHVVLDFLGPISNPRLTNLSCLDSTGNPFWVEIDVTVGAGKHLVVDCAAFTAVNDIVNAIGSVKHSGGLPWMFMEVGVNSLQVTAGSPGGTLTITHTPPYL